MYDIKSIKNKTKKEIALDICGIVIDRMRSELDKHAPQMGWQAAMVVGDTKARHDIDKYIENIG